MKLFETYALGSLNLKNRMVMAPMTRSRANTKGIVSESTALYYKQRVSAGLIISEAINISQQAQGSPYTPGIYNHEQIEAWKTITQTVHEHGGLIVAQLWHTGRVGHSLVKNGEIPVAPSAIAIRGQQHFTMEGPKNYEVPRELRKDEILDIIQDYKNAAINAIHAGFDGVELHSAFGYLPNQFLADSSNQRNDEYGGSNENRNRFVVEIMNAMVEAVGSQKVGIRLSPTGTYNNILHSNPVEQFTMLIQELNDMPLSYIHLMNIPVSKEKYPQYPDNPIQIFGRMSEHPIIANTGYTKDTAEDELKNGIASLISFGSLFLANPDLPKRFEINASLNPIDPSTMYGGDDKGYIDYPFLP